MLERIEKIGNALPDPATLFLLGALAVMGLSQLAVALDWSVEKTLTRDIRVAVVGPDGAPVVDPVSGAPVTVAKLDAATGGPLRESVQVRVEPTSLLTSDGIYWAVSSLVDNFKNFPPLAIVLVGMLGIGLAERTGFIAALLKATLLAVPPALLTPTVFFVGVMSSMALDAGYVVLPPVAMALFAAAGRSPLVGLAAVFAGTSAGFSANLAPTSLEPLLAGFSTSAAQILAPDYEVAVTANLTFIQVSTVLLTLVGWAVTAWWVEPRYHALAADEGGATPLSDAEAEDARTLRPEERRGLRWGGTAAALTLALFVAVTLIPGAPLHGLDGIFPRWVHAVVPLIFIGFFVPGLAYGIAAGQLKSDKDVAVRLGETMAAMGPYIVLAFFAAQFVEYFRHSGLGEMLAITGGRALTRADLAPGLLMTAFIGIVMLGNLFIGSMSAKYAFFAPVFVPMFMQVGISPELTQAAYRVGDSVSNVITPLNPYVVIILVFMRRYVPKAGIGTLVALMLPYTLVFAVTWTLLLVLWMASGLPLGEAGPLTYTP